jgi:hypothetical protein
MSQHVNLVKLCVGCDSPDQLESWQTARAEGDPAYQPRHVTRMWPKREAELVDGGSLYWVFKGAILARQRLLSLDEVIGEDGIRRCGLVLDRELVRTSAAPRRPFQGWRYLAAADAPADLSKARASDDTLPPALAGALADIGIL